MAEVRFSVKLDGVEQTVNSINDLEDALKRTKSELANVDIGSAAFKDLQKQARALDSELKNIQKATEGVDTAKLAGSFAKLGETVVGGFAVATSALKLFGRESEDLTKAQEQAQQTLTLILGARAIAEGVVEGAAAARLIVDKVSLITTNALTIAFGRQTVALAAEAAAAGTATAAQTALNTAMKLSPIGLLIGSITALIVYWEDLAEATGLANTDLEEYNATQDKVSKEAQDKLATSLASITTNFNELQNAISQTTGAAQKSWLTTALKDLPELINLTGDEADAVDQVNEALQFRITLGQAEEKRKTNLELISGLLKDIATGEREGVKLSQEQLNSASNRINTLRDENQVLAQQIGTLKAQLDATISTEAAKKKAVEETKKASDEAFKKRLEQIKQEREEVRQLLLSIRQETKQNLEDIAIDQEEANANLIEDTFLREQKLLEISAKRQNTELERQRQANIEKIKSTSLSANEETKAIEVINQEFAKRRQANEEALQQNLVELNQRRAEQVAQVDAALLTELNFGDAQFADTRRKRELDDAAFRNELSQRRLTDGVIFDRLTIKQREDYLNTLNQLEQDSLDIQRQQRIADNNAEEQRELQLARDRFKRGELTAEQLGQIEANLLTTRLQKNAQVEEDIAQQRIAINKKTEEQILQERIRGIQTYLQFATQGLQALSTVSQTIETVRLQNVDAANQRELEANNSKNQSILDQEIARINNEQISETEKQKKIEAASKKAQDQKAKDDKKTEDKIEKQRNEIRKQAFARTKALNIATALVNGAQSVLQAIAQFGPPPSPLGIAGIAAAGVITAAQVAAIASQQYQETGGTTPSLNLPDTTANIAGGETAGPANTGGFSLFNPDLVNITQTGGRGAAGGGGSTGPLRVIVVESDITDVQGRVRATVDQASFG